MNAVPGALGALGLDVLLGFLPIPATWKAGMFGYLTKAIGAVGLGMLANTVVSGRTATQMTEGALTVMLHGALRELVATNLPAVPLGMYIPGEGMSGLGYYGAGYNPAYGISDRDALSESGMNEYLPDISESEGEMIATEADYM